MTRLRSGFLWMFALGTLVVSLAGCPRYDFPLGGIDAGAGDGGSDGVRCGSPGLAECGDDQYCDFPDGAACGAADVSGICRPRPDVCTEEYDPVCGCDGKTHGTRCAANAAGISVAHDGECESSPEPKSCGGLTGAGCDDGQYCKYAPDAICGAADATGICTDQPEACDLIYQPVCGCDDKTYGNACDAAMNGVSVASQGECGGNSGQRTCGGLLGGRCNAGEFCDYPLDAMCGIADAPGVCAPIPSVCTREYAPVCGCNGETYGNACEANAAGVGIMSRGECESSSPRACGVRGTPECAADEYCRFSLEAQCGAADQPGECASRPEVCTEELREVCGCDGNTYGNACAAAAAGVSAAHEGPCETAGAACGGITGASCGDGQYCNFPESAQCGAADQTGVCTDKPEGCTKEYNPVCGCDDKTYGNACTAAAAGVSIAKVGECTGTSGSGVVCGGLLGAGCSDGEYCNYPPSAQCGAADQTGICEVKPEACTLDYTPVCGCDDMTYGNACAAAAAGVSVVRPGEC